MGWAWKQPSPKDCVTAQRREPGQSSIRGSKPTTDPSCPAPRVEPRLPGWAVAVRSPQGGGEVRMLTRVAATVTITVVRRPRVPPAGFAAEGHPVPHTCAWMGWAWHPQATGNEHPLFGGGPYPKPTQVGRQRMLGPRANHSEGTRQLCSLPSEDGASLHPSLLEGGRGRGDGTHQGIAPVYQKHRARQTHFGGGIGPEACPVPVGEEVPSGTWKPRSTTAVTLTVLR